MSDTDHDSHGYRWQRTAAIVVLLLVAYPLSAGPANWGFKMAHRLDLTATPAADAVRAFYWPLTRLPDSLLLPLKKYASWWGQ